MDIDDDDEFGDLYTDVIRPLSISSSGPNPSQDPLTITGSDRIPTKNPSLSRPLETLDSFSGENPKEDWLPDNWNDEGDDDSNVPVPVPVKAKVEVEARVSGSIGKDEASRVSEAEDFKIGNLDQEPVIPGLSTASLPRVSNADDDWDNDSDSEDDLQIVLNDNHHMPMGAMDDDDDGEEDLVIVTDNDQQQHHHQQGIEEQDWGEGELPSAAADGERKEGSEATKVNGAVAVVSGGPRIGYSHGFHPQHHSMYKYVRPGVAAPGAPPGQIRPPPTIGSFGGRGRGDWRPAGIRGFHSGFGPGWSNNPSRAFGGGLDFNLPSHKTIFDVDVEGFEDKPWRQSTVDISDYFNFGLDESKWKEYCKQVDQVRLESTMQGKIRVYESGRSQQEYDPDLPPELAAAAGHHDISTDNVNHAKIDNCQTDLSGQERPFVRALFPPGRAIQVETGSGERLPSIDTRPPRYRDADAIIEIVCRDFMEDSTIHTTATEQPDKHTHDEELKVVHAAEGDRHSESEYHDAFLQTSSGHKREMGSRRIPHATERSFRLPDGATDGRHSSAIVKYSRDSIPIQSSQDKKHADHPKERPGSSMETPELSLGTARELSVEQKDGELDGMLALGNSVEAKGELEGEETSDIRISGETLVDESITYSSKKQKLSSRVEQSAIQDSVDDDDLRITHSDNSKAKSGNSNQKRRESGDEEVQGGWSRRTSNMRRRHEKEEYPFRQQDNYGREDRHEMDRMRVGSRGREAMYHSYPHRDFDPFSVHPVRGRSEGFERPREMESAFWQRREDETHGRRIKDEDIRRSKVRISDRVDKDDGDWRGHNREGGTRLRKRDDLSRRDNSDDHQGKRMKDKEHSRRERTEKEDSLHGHHRARQGSSQQNKERDDNPELKRREGSSGMRDKAEDHHFSKHKDERQRLKHSHEDFLLHTEREEGRVASRSGRATEDKSLSGGARNNKSDSKLLASDKDYQQKDKRRHGEQSKRGRAEEENDSQYKEHEDGHARDKFSRHEKLSASDDLKISKEKHREVTRKNRDTEAAALGKRKSDNHSAHRNEKLCPMPVAVLYPSSCKHSFSQGSSKGKNDQESNNSRVNQMPRSSEKHGGGDLASDDESQRDSKRGRSKLERWTSHKERDYSSRDNLHSSSSRAKDVESVSNDLAPIDELQITEGNNDGDQTADKSGDDRDRHLDTVEKLKRRSERFKLPMPGEKDVASSKRSENNASLITQNEVPAYTEAKPERPARKRRWTSS
ncbi:FIP1[V]-like protein isoform X1 [Asparagus officinalis]|uniref:FIP1[V]-like protein isoform X1 n=1 Tax=Asparagus officinalis TaxID=4686 RepID=UPI00098DE671|nr:FIP1[V]-like protein isoform X1 [Asparagus officinalis]